MRAQGWLCVVAAWCSIAGGSGCYAPLKSCGIHARHLPNEFRTPVRTAGTPLNFAFLTQPPATQYLLGADDVLEITVPGLFERTAVEPIRVRVMPNGTVSLPLIGSVKIGGSTVEAAQATITERYADGYLVKPKVSLFLAEKATSRVVVLGKVAVPGVYELFKYENDVGHALAAAGGLTEDAADLIEVHRRAGSVDQPMLFAPCQAAEPIQGFLSGSAEPARPRDQLTGPLPSPNAAGGESAVDISRLPPPDTDAQSIFRIPLRGLPPEAIQPSDITLQSGDVVFVPDRRNEVFYVVGKLNPINVVRFVASERDRELGGGFIMPREREIDVVEAVAMAGYIDPIDSPTTVTVHRRLPNGEPLLIRVNLIKARHDAQETVLISPGDIVYLNPDAAWWFRRTFDRIIPDLILAAGFRNNN